jgi:hypothetical protein
MNINWTSVKDFLGEISGYKPLYEATVNELQIATAKLSMCTTRVAELDTLLTEAQATILHLTPPTPAPPAPDNTTQIDTAPVQPQEGTVLRRIRSQQVVDCPRENRDVPLYATEAGANHAQLTCRSCPQYKSETCNYLTCQYGG